ncbi:MAG: UDP-2,3-diacylglucosamine diphosphatase [Wenzhouxiangella sp.]|nr:MAG: UDP-2,3-diacylglucosamine diphosphatase [Wenzhouxiangella sp.]
MTTEPGFAFKRHVRSIWISDVHLGYSGCSADHLLGFLRQMRCQNLFLVGDIVDFWSLKRRRYWPQSHNNVVRSILGKAKHGTRVVFVPGNHDEVMRDYDGMTLGQVEIRDELIHVTADGRRLLIMHGDQFDSAVMHSRLIGLVGSKLYDGLLWVNGWVNWVRRKIGRDYWSLAAFLKNRVKNAVNYIENFERAVAREAKVRNVDGLVCGHIHRPTISSIDDKLYLNCGDWVESCTALLEHHDGSIELVHFSDRAESLEMLEPVVTHRAA